jgi:hypothetical protein
LVVGAEGSDDVKMIAPYQSAAASQRIIAGRRGAAWPARARPGNRGAPR